MVFLDFFFRLSFFLLSFLKASEFLLDRSVIDVFNVVAIWDPWYLTESQETEGPLESVQSKTLLKAGSITAGCSGFSIPPGMKVL